MFTYGRWIKPTANYSLTIVRPNLLSTPVTLATGRTAAYHVGTRRRHLSLLNNNRCFFTLFVSFLAVNVHAGIYSGLGGSVVSRSCIFGAAIWSANVKFDIVHTGDFLAPSVSASAFSHGPTDD